VKDIRDRAGTQAEEEMLWFDAQAHDMDGKESSPLTPHERAKKYRALAADSRKAAERVTDKAERESRIMLAEKWERLAANVERRSEAPSR
jgi:hypothetical protein